MADGRTVNIGEDSSNNTAATTNVAANEDGSVLERLEQLQEAVNRGTGTSIAANKSLVDALGTDGSTVSDAAVSVLGAIGANNANNAFSSSSVVANDDGSVLERLEGIKDPTGAYVPRFGYRVTKVGDVASAPDDLFTVTGKCLVTLMVGEVTSVIATTQSLALVTSTGNQTIAAVTQIAADDVGTLYMVSGDPDLALNGATTPGIDAALLTNGSLAPFLMNDDKIYQSINGAGTGTIQWDLYYLPLETSASVASSA